VWIRAWAGKRGGVRGYSLGKTYISWEKKTEERTNELLINLRASIRGGDFYGKGLQCTKTERLRSTKRTGVQPQGTESIALLAVYHGGQASSTGERG